MTDLRPVHEVLAGFSDEDYPRFLFATIDDPTTEEGLKLLYEPTVLARLATIKRDKPQVWLGAVVPEARARRVWLPDLEQAMAPSLRTNGALPPPETLTALLAADIPKPRQFFPGLLHEGMLLFGGKSKRGKSWLMFDLALALALGNSAFRHFACADPANVLYLALEDGRARLQGRARMIQPNLVSADRFHLRYSFPPLAEGGVALLADEIRKYQYGLVVVDVLAKVETPTKNGEKHYHEVYQMFAPLQELRQSQPFCLAMLTHLRKHEAEDVFDNLMGSVAYQGAQEVLWVLERKPKDDYAFLHTRDKDAEDQTMALRFMDGHWEFIGEGEEYELSKDQRTVIAILTEEKVPMRIQEIMKAGDFPEAKYGYVRKLLMSMVKDDMIYRTDRGSYSATLHGAEISAPRKPPLRSVKRRAQNDNEDYDRF